MSRRQTHTAAVESAQALVRALEVENTWSAHVANAVSQVFVDGPLRHSERSPVPNGREMPAVDQPIHRGLPDLHEGGDFGNGEKTSRIHTAVPSCPFLRGLRALSRRGVWLFYVALPNAVHPGAARPRGSAGFRSGVSWVSSRGSEGGGDARQGGEELVEEALSGRGWLWWCLECGGVAGEGAAEVGGVVTRHRGLLGWTRRLSGRGWRMAVLAPPLDGPNRGAASVQRSSGR